MGVQLEPDMWQETQKGSSFRISIIFSVLFNLINYISVILFLSVFLFVEKIINVSKMFNCFELCADEILEKREI